MTPKSPVRKVQIALAILGLVLVAAISIVALLSRRAQHGATLAHGFTFTLKQVAFTSTNFNYSHSTRGRWWQFLEPVLPAPILQRFPSNGGSFGFGSDGSTNLFVITDLLRTGSATGDVFIGRLRISDGTNKFDADWGASTLGWPNETVNGWQVRAFPRRARDLTLEFLSGGDAATNWSVAARFTVPNPAYGTFPQWQPEPKTQIDSNLTVHLASFRSGALMDPARTGTDAHAAARKTEMLFTFEQDGRPTDNWRVQKLFISDATGNNWFPYLDLETQRFNWAKGGQLEFLGALWPGENAWQLDLEASQIGGLTPDDQFTLQLPLPAPGQLAQFTNQWLHSDTSVQFVGLASPNTDFTSGAFRWTAKWWGEDKDKVYALALSLSQPPGQKSRLHLVSAADQNDAPVKLLEHRSQDYNEQALFLQPSPDAQHLTLTFSLTRSRFVRFRARPDFVEQ